MPFGPSTVQAPVTSLAPTAQLNLASQAIMGQLMPDMSHMTSLPQ